MRLNLGCGDLAYAGFIGVDRDREAGALELCADLRYLPFRPGVIHSIIMFEVLEHVGDFQRVIDEIFRVLIPGGVITLSIPNQYYYRIMYYFIWRTQTFSTPEHIHGFKESELKNAFHAFTHVKTWFDTTHWHTVRWYERVFPPHLKHRSLFIRFQK